jgi:hypothetical protein
MPTTARLVAAVLLFPALVVIGGVGALAWVMRRRRSRALD